MPTPRRKAAAPAPVAPVQTPVVVANDEPINHLKRRVEVVYKDINDIEAYEWNPRDNAKAVAAVAASIRTFGFLVPCVIDSNNILIAGHTRVEASKTLGLTEIPCIVADDLTPEEANAFRLIDNKVSEQAEWNFDLLAGEIGKLDSLGLDFTEFGWTQNEIDCLSDLVAQDCLNPANLVAPPSESEPEQVQRRAPTQARMVLGEFVFFIPATVYRNWADGLRQMTNFSEEAITEELKRRLGILSE